MGQTARQRAEQRALRLYVHGPECRPLLAALVLQEPSCRAALELSAVLDLLEPSGSDSKTSSVRWVSVAD